MHANSASNRRRITGQQSIDLYSDRVTKHVPESRDRPPTGTESIMDDHYRDTQPHGALVPPPTLPPLALATSAPLPPRRPGRGAMQPRRSRFARLLDSALHALDEVADRIAVAAGLR